MPHRGRQVTSLTYLQILEQDAGVCTGANALAYRKKCKARPERSSVFPKRFSVFPSLLGGVPLVQVSVKKIDKA